MARKAYEIEILFTTGGARRLGRHFKSQKAAREWCERAGMAPVFGGSRPCMFWTAEDRDGWHGMQATIREAGAQLWPKDSTEGRVARKLARAYA